MHLVGFTIEIYYEALPYERQICLLHVSNIKVFILRKPCTCSFVVFFHAAVDVWMCLTKHILPNASRIELDH
jgi:hypothetical protein